MDCTVNSSAPSVMLLHLPEQPRITTAPAVDGLFHIAHAEKGTVRILHRFIHQILHHTPLRSAGILKFIQQPMIKRAVSRYSNDNRSGPTPPNTGRLLLEPIAPVNPQRSTALPSDQSVIAAVVFPQHGKHPTRPLQQPVEFCRQTMSQ